jgi:hypothetical protein
MVSYISTFMEGILSDRHCISQQDIYLQSQLGPPNCTGIERKQPSEPRNVCNCVFVVRSTRVRFPPITFRNFFSNSKYLEVRVPYRRRNFPPKSHLTTDNMFPYRRQESQDYR